MVTLDKETAIPEMPAERVSKLLIFMAGMEAERAAEKRQGDMVSTLLTRDKRADAEPVQ